MNPHERVQRSVGQRQPGTDSCTRRSALQLDGRPAFHNEPLTDFSREDVRQQMQAALDASRRSSARPTRWSSTARRSRRPRRCRSVNPSHQRRSSASARRPQSTTPSGDRGREGRVPGVARHHAAAAPTTCSQAAERFRERRFELAAWEVYEAGKPWREADADVAEAIDFCEYYAARCSASATPQRRDVPGEENAYFYEPRGVAVVIAPWNFPLAILAGMTTAALVTGNTVVMKPAEQSAVIGAKLMEVFAGGRPAGGRRQLPARRRRGDRADARRPSGRRADRLHRLAGVGLQINEQAPKTPPGQDHVKRVIAEMGGKNAIIVDADADLDEAVKGVVAARSATRARSARRARGRSCWSRSTTRSSPG